MPEASEIQLTAEWIAAVVSGALVSGRAEQRFTGVSIDTRTLGAGRAVRRHSRRALRRRGVRRGGDRGGRGRRDGAARPASGRPGEGGGDRGRRHDGGAAGARARGPHRVGHEGRGDHRQRREDHDEGNDGGAARVAISRDSQPRQLQQPHRAAAVAHRPEAAAGYRSRRTRHEPHRGNQHARRTSPSRTCACLDERRRGPPGILRVGRRDRRRQGRDLRARDAGDRARRQRRRRADRGAAAALRRTRGDLRHRPRRGRSRDGSRGPRHRRHDRPRLGRREADDRRHPLLGRGNLANLLAATAVALEFDIPLAAIADRAAGARAGLPTRARSSVSRGA